METVIYDELGYEWRYNPEQHRLYLLDAEKEFDPNRDNLFDNGYFCKTLMSAKRMMRQDYGLRE